MTGKLSKLSSGSSTVRDEVMFDWEGSVSESEDEEQLEPRGQAERSGDSPLSALDWLLLAAVLTQVIAITRMTMLSRTPEIVAARIIRRGRGSTIEKIVTR